MTDAESFVAAMIRDDADDTTRVVFADWLDEHGRGAHAELIRVQVELGRRCGSWLLKCRAPVSVSRAPSNVRACGQCELCLLRDRESTLIAELAPRCPVCGGAGNYLGHPVAQCSHCSGTGYVGTFERGFLAEVRVPSIAAVLVQTRVRGCRQCLAAASGDEASCRHCGGELWSTPRPHWLPTDYGHALVAEHPLLARVIPVNREPWHTIGGEYGWWETGDEPDGTTDVPAPVFAAVRRKHPESLREPGGEGIFFLAFPTPADATDALGTALCETLRETAAG